MRQSLLAAAIAAVSAVSMAAEPRAIPRDEVPAALAPAAARGDAAIDDFRERLLARLTEAMQGGSVHAIGACRADAPGLAKDVGDQHHVRLGRTAVRLRNPKNAPPAWTKGYVEAAGGKKAAEVKPAVFDLGDRIGLLRPIGVLPACTRCHGAVDAIDPDVRAAIARDYPADQATGFAPGDLRGFFWVEVPKR